MNRKTFLTLLAALSLLVLGAALSLADLAQAAEDPPAQPDAWLSPGSLPQAWAGAVVQCADQPDVFYRLGGVLAGEVETNKLDRYDVATDTWTTLTGMPQVRRIVAATCYQGKIYAAGGLGSNAVRNTLYIYDIALGFWSYGANLPSAVWGSALGVWEGKLYLVGGTYSGSSPWPPTDRVDVYDIATETWTTGGGKPMPTPASFPGWVQRGQYLYLVGGMSGNLAANVDQTQRYDMATDTWEAGPTFTSQRALAVLGMTSRHLYALGGDANGGSGFDATNLVEALDLTAWPGGAWTDLGDPLPQVNIFPSSACSEAMAGGEIWAVGGADGSLAAYSSFYYRPSEPCFYADYFGNLLEEELNGAAMPGETAAYTLHLFNAGVYSDTYDIDASGLWTVTVPITVGPVMAGETVQFEVNVDVPPGAAPMDWDTAVITVTSQGDANAVDTASLTTYANGWFHAGTLLQEMAVYTVQCPEAPDYIYTVGGIGAGNTTLDTVYRYNAVADNWETLQPLPEPRRGEALVCYQGKIYAAGGVYQSVVRNTLYIYDIATDTWSVGASLPDIIGGAGLGAWEGKLYLAGGSRELNPWTPVDRVDVYDIATDTWAAGAGMAMPTASSYFGSVQRGPFLFAVGGLSGDINVNIDQTQRYNMLENTWEIGPTFTSERGVVALATTATHLYALGGTQEGGGALDTAEVLDLSAWPGGAWTDLGDPLPQPNVYPASACTEAKVGGDVWIIGGGLNISTFYDDLYYRGAGPCFDFYFGDLPEEAMTGGAGPGGTAHYLLDLTNTSIHPDTFDIISSGVWTVTAPATVGPVAAWNTVQVAVDVAVPPGASRYDWDTALITVTSQGDPNAWDAAALTTLANGWVDIGPLDQPRAGVVVQCPDQPDAFYRLGGVLAGELETNWLEYYDVATNTWDTTLAGMPQVRRIVAAACYQGKIYAAGGYGGDTIRNTLYIYDIADDNWSIGAPTPNPVWGAALGAWEGKLYLVGGTYNPYPFAPTARVDVYDIATDTWTLGGGTWMPTAASFPGARQRGPYLYLVGGISGNFAANVNQTLRYDMATDTWEAGPEFTSQRALVGMGMTESHLYALGGDANGGDAFDATDLVEVLDLNAWPGGAWTEAAARLPEVNIYPASACSEALTGGEIWAVGGADGTLEAYDSFYYLPAEPCLHYGPALPPPIAGAGLVGQTLDYLLTITNTSVVTDYYQLAFSSTWTVNPLPAAPVMVGPGQSVEVAFGVEVPADALDGESALTEVTATSLSNYMESDTTTFTSVALGYTFDWRFDAPAHAGLPGQVVTYTLTITNVGHLADSYLLTATGYAWAVMLPAAPIALDVGESAEVAVMVALPLCACPGQADAVTITATSQGNALVSQSEALTTSAGGYRVSIPLVLRD